MESESALGHNTILIKDFFVLVILIKSLPCPLNSQILVFHILPEVLLHSFLQLEYPSWIQSEANWKSGSEPRISTAEQ